MSDGRKTGRKAPGERSHLSREDAELWRRVTDTATPLDRDRGRVIPTAQPSEGTEKPQSVSGKTKTSKRPRPTPAPSDKPKPVPKPAPAAGFHRREARQLASGRIAIDARLDLHGMRQREAHGALKAFLARAQAKGHRYVLIITGKGGANRDEADTSFYEERDRGVLKRLVPQWLNEAGLRPYIVGYEQARVRHGGEGALYVRLRRPGG